MTILLTAAALWLTSPALVWLWIKADEFLDGSWADETPTALPDPDAEWLALLAATEPTPIYDRLVCEQIEREEWSS